MQDTKQFVFTQESSATIQVTALLSQEDPRMNASVGAPIKA
jgi:hypothetical protein